MQQKNQAGFTLIELIIVIIILGVLSVVAAPKFIDLTNDAIAPELNAIKGAIKSANTLVYAKAMIAGQEKLESGSVTIKGQTVNTTLGNIAPLGANLILTLDGSFELMVNANDEITADWGIYDIPGGKSVYVVPKGYATFDNCNLLYNVDPSFSTEPTFYSVTSSGC
ncbi:prepilin-type N-terminal cleavage/methylation domain-containing protein [Paraglaciecola aestuariivivens]